MPMIRTCSAPGCRTRTLGEFCLEHEPLPASDVGTSPAPARPATLSAKPAQLPVALVDVGRSGSRRRLAIEKTPGDP